jgi:hypothetical protein
MKLIFENWYKFIAETKFEQLKNSGLVGFLPRELYPGILSILNDNDEYLIDEEVILWDYTNELLTEKINKHTFYQDISTVFDPKRLEVTREPISVKEEKIAEIDPNFRVLHYLVDPTDPKSFKNIPKKIVESILFCFKNSLDMGLEPASRYCYLTFDQSRVKKGSSQRQRGFHIDGMQGLEVPVKKNADYQYIWSDVHPTTFCTKTFNLEGFEAGEHNIFTWIENQVENKLCYPLRANSFYLMNAYHVHEASKVSESGYRKFLRVSFTNTPVTSRMATINPNIEYDYEVGTTSGLIPSFLK